MKREIVDYEVRGFKEVGDDIKPVVMKTTFEVEEDIDEPSLSGEDCYCVVVEATDGEVLVEKWGRFIFKEEEIDEIVADQRKVDENVEVKVYTSKNIIFTDFFYDKDNKMIFDQYFDIHITNVETLPSNILEIVTKLRLLSRVYGTIWMDINDTSKIDEMIEENFIIE